jgi:hypothetical protein
MSRGVKLKAGRPVAVVLVLLVLTTLGPSIASATPPSAPSKPAEGPGRPLVLAHYYIWFTPASWNRAKRDEPLMGRYSSDDVDVMKQHISQARSAGIDGFIVSWKSSPVLNQRLANLIRVAQEEHFKLAITYQGLDFDRAPLPAPRIAADLKFFVDTYGANPVFDIFGKPMVVLTGTPVMSKKTIARIGRPLQERLLLLASDKNVESYNKIADEVDGNLYYWSSVNPSTFDNYARKLEDFGNAVRAHGGIWVAPAAPGFDARLVGGTSVVDRQGGETLRQEWDAASRSLPTAIGLISWNEFSENTQIEPSKLYGSRYLDVLADLTGAPTPIAPADSSEPSGTGGPARAIFALASMAALVVISVGILVRRSFRFPRARRVLS